MRRSSSFRLSSVALVLVVCGFALSSAVAEDWIFLPAAEIGAPEFLAAHPTYDGRGVIVAVLDTGVDMTIPGLRARPDGSAKVIDARDFTGQGAIDLEPAIFEGDFLRVNEDLRLEGFGQLALAPAEEHLVWTGVLDESRFLNSGGLQDLDDSGSDDDAFGIVVFGVARDRVRDVLGEGAGVKMRRGWGDAAADEEAAIARRELEWIVVVDTDRDGHLDDEELRRDYATNFESFTLKRAAREGSRALLGIAVDVRGEKKPELNLHFDDGGHGSHVAGIAAGFGVHGQEGLNGVAPGAWVVSCKLGDNSLSGGATVTGSMRKAYEYVGELSDRYDVPIVINMSYGIGSEFEGDAAMEGWLDDWLDEHSDVVVCHSASNSGPGLSNVGLPAGADGVIASAAMITKDMARDLYGGAFVKDELYGFSSRGGELAKPDVAAPGGASSTVPLWDTYDRYNGTSMASPQTAGATACVMSGLKQTDRGWNFGTMKRAVMASAKKLVGYTRIDAGAGVVNLPAYWQAAVEYADAGEDELVTIYTVRTEAPAQPDGEAPAAYWRAGGYFPAAPEQQEFEVTPRFADDASENARNEFYRAFTLRSDVDWIRVDRDETYINGPSERSIFLSYDASRLTEPGVYVGTVTAEAKGSGRSGAAAHEFQLVATIVIPFEGNDLEWEGQRLDPGAFARRFFRVSPSASAFTATLAVPEGYDGSVRMILHDPDGRRIARSPFADSTVQPEQSWTISGEDLLAGTWEVDVRGAYELDARATYDLAVRVDGLHARPAVVNELAFDAPGTVPTCSVFVTPAFDAPFRGAAEGEIDTWWRQRTVEVEESVWEYEFTVDESIAAVEFTVDMDPAIYGRFTDCAVNIADDSGKFLVQSGLDARSDTVRLSDPVPGSYTLQLNGGFALDEHAADWHFELIERFELARSVHLVGTGHGESALRLVPDVASEVEFEADGSPQSPPSGFFNAGELRFVEDVTGHVALRVPIRLDAKGD